MDDVLVVGVSMDAAADAMDEAVVAADAMDEAVVAEVSMDAGFETHAVQAAVNLVMDAAHVGADFGIAAVTTSFAGEYSGVVLSDLLW